MHHFQCAAFKADYVWTSSLKIQMPEVFFEQIFDVLQSNLIFTLE